MDLSNNQIKVFCCYAREDEELLRELKSHLRVLERRNLINVWYDRDIRAGAMWGQEIHKHLNEAQIILLLISSDFIASDYCYGTEMVQAVERYERNEVILIPIILRPVNWYAIPIGNRNKNITLGDLLALPKDAKPVITWDRDNEKHDLAWTNVVGNIEKVTNELRGEAPVDQSSPSVNLPLSPKLSPSFKDFLAESYSYQSPAPISIPHSKKLRHLTAFICYAANAKDREKADDLYNRLAEYNIKVWMYQRDMLPGIPWEDERRKQIEDCDIFIPCVSSRFEEASDGDRHAEVRIALRVAERKKSIYIVPLLLEPFKEVPDEFRGLSCVEYFRKDGFQQLMRALEQKRLQLNGFKETILPLYHQKKPPSLLTRRKILATLGGGVVVVSVSGFLFKVIQIPTQAKLFAFTPPPITPATVAPTPYTSFLTSFSEQYGQAIHAVSWSPDAKKLAVAYENNLADIWDAITQQVIVQYRNHTGAVEGISWSPDGKYIVSGSADGTAQIWNELGTTSGVYTGHREIDRSVQHPWINRVQWSPDGAWIASCDQTSDPNATATVQIWNPQNRQTRFTYREHKDGVYSLAWSPDNSSIASVGYDGTLRVWEALSGKTLTTVPPGKSVRKLYGVAWSHDGHDIVFGGDDYMVWLLDLRGNELLPIYPLPVQAGQGVRDVAFSPNGSYYAVSTDNQGVFVFETSGNGLFKHYTLQDITGDISALGWSPKRPELAMGNSTGTNYSVQLWKTPLG